MQKKLKRAFTIVELVIVIAIISVLAAVLVPTFSSIYYKALASTDTQTAKNLNTLLSTEAAFDQTPTSNIFEVEKILTENGYDVNDLSARNKNNRFVYEMVSNQILYLDENGEVIFSSRQYDKNNVEIWEFCQTLSLEGLADGGNYYLTESVSIDGDLLITDGLCIASGKTLTVNNAYVKRGADLIGDIVGNKFYQITLNNSLTAEVAEQDKYVTEETTFIKSMATVTISSSSALSEVFVNGEKIQKTGEGFTFAMPEACTEVSAAFAESEETPIIPPTDETPETDEEKDKESDNKEEISEPEATFTLSYEFKALNIYSVITYYIGGEKTEQASGIFDTYNKNSKVLIYYSDEKCTRLIIEFNEVKTILRVHHDNNVGGEYRKLYAIINDVEITTEPQGFTMDKSYTLIINY